ETRGARAAMRADRRVDRQRQVREDLPEEEIGARVAGDEIRVLTDPAEAGVACNRFLEHGRAVGEDAVAERTYVRLDRIGELLQALPHHLVVVAAERIARDVRASRIAKGTDGVGGFAGPIIEARRDDPGRAGHELRGPRAFRAVARHVVELAVPAEREPALELRFVVAKIDAADADLAEAERGRLLANPVRERGELRGRERSPLGRPRRWKHVLGHLGVLACAIEGSGATDAGRGTMKRWPPRRSTGSQYNGAMMSEPDPLPTDIYSAGQVRSIDRVAIDELGIPGYELMCRAGTAALAELRR